MSSTFGDDSEGFDWRSVGYRLRSALAVLVSLAVLAGGGWFIYSQASQLWADFTAEEDYEGPGVDDVQVVIPSGAGLAQIGDILVSADVVMSRSHFRDVASSHPDAGSVQPGRYNLKTRIPSQLAIEMLLDPANREVIQVRILEGLTIHQQWASMAEQLDLDAEEIRAAATSGQLELPEFVGGKLEGIMFPDTYQVNEPIVPLNILRSQLNQFRAVAEAVEMESRSEALDMTQLETLTIASIIEREVGQAEYRPLVSAVIHNRLDDGMPLQMDSTVHYAVGRSDTVTTTAEERAMDHPYNTYYYSGLPPGPISNPGRAAIEAALAPADSDALFFVTVNLDTGETKFAATLEEHEVNVAEFQSWCQANTGRC